MDEAPLKEASTEDRRDWLYSQGSAGGARCGGRFEGAALVGGGGRWGIAGLKSEGARVGKKVVSCSWPWFNGNITQQFDNLDIRSEAVRRTSVA